MVDLSKVSSKSFGSSKKKRHTESVVFLFVFYAARKQRACGPMDRRRLLTGSNASAAGGRRSERENGQKQGVAEGCNAFRRDDHCFNRGGSLVRVGQGEPEKATCFDKSLFQ